MCRNIIRPGGAYRTSKQVSSRKAVAFSVGASPRNKTLLIEGSRRILIVTHFVQLALDVTGKL